MKEFCSEKLIQGRETCAYGDGEFWLPVFPGRLCDVCVKALDGELKQLYLRNDSLHSHAISRSELFSMLFIYFLYF